MAKRGDVARENVKNTIINAFGENFVAFVDKKIYVWASDGGEMIQFAISMTMPKNTIEAEAKENVVAAGALIERSITPTELSTEDKEKVEMLKKKLGIE